jgi:anti-sigma factor RsiW
MMNETHSSWTDQLSDYLDGGLTEAERDALEAHLEACPACRTVHAELRALVERARALGDTPPERDLWPGIADAIGAPGRQRAAAGVIELPTATRARPTRSGLFLTVPELAAASVVLALVSATATWWVGPGLATAPDVSKKGDVAVPTTEAAAVFPAADVAGPPPELAAELLRLEEALSAARGQLEPNTVRILEKNLGVIERAIDESGWALALDPNNGFLREHLERTYQDKLDYLREAVGIADWTG